MKYLTYAATIVGLALTLLMPNLTMAQNNTTKPAMEDTTSFNLGKDLQTSNKSRFGILDSDLEDGIPSSEEQSYYFGGMSIGFLNLAIIGRSASFEATDNYEDFWAPSFFADWTALSLDL